MSDKKAFSGSILRVFEARAKPGYADSLAKKFATTSVDVVRNQPGNQGHFFGRSVSDEDDVFLSNTSYRGWIGIQVNSPAAGRIDTPPLIAITKNALQRHLFC